MTTNLNYNPSANLSGQELGNGFVNMCFGLFSRKDVRDGLNQHLINPLLQDIENRYYYHFVGLVLLLVTIIVLLAIIIYKKYIQ